MFSRTRSLVWSLIFLLAGVALWFVFSPSGPEHRFSVRGIVRAPYADGAITIQHEAIPDYMPAMTMPFNVKAEEVREFVPGDVVEFEFLVREEKSRAERFRRVGRAASSEPGSRTPSGVTRLREGDALPAFALLDQDGRALTEADLRGRQTILTFIFTRCPVPEFCPLIGRKFQALQRELAGGNPDVRLLSITIDPEHDRPAVLRQYGESLAADFERWRFATGTAEQVDALTKLFAVRRENNGTSLDHTLATALIGAEGKVVEIWRGNAWKPEEVLARVGQ